MKTLLAVVMLLSLAAVADAGGVTVVNNNNNNNNARMNANANANIIRPRRPVLRFLFPRVALSRDARFGPPNAVRVGGGAFVQTR